MKQHKWFIILSCVLFAGICIAELANASFMADDFIQLGGLRGVNPSPWFTPFNLYTLSDGDAAHVAAMKNAGAFPWYFNPRFKMVFFRPLSSLLLALDHAVFGLRPLGYRVHSLIWFGLLLTGCWLTLRRFLSGWLLPLALFIFAFSAIHGILSWIATRHIVIAAALGVFGLACHIYWRETHWRPGRYLELACFALAFTASEAAIGVVAYLLAYEIFRAPGTKRERVAASLPVGMLTAFYLLLYKILGLGTVGGSGYINPLQAPIAFLLALPGRFSFLIGSMLLGGNADIWVLRPHLRTILSITGALVIICIAFVLRAIWSRIPAAERKTLNWLFTASLAAALPFVGTVIGSRCLVAPFLGGSAVIAYIIYQWWTWLRAQAGLATRFLASICAILAVIHLVFAPSQRLLTPSFLRRMMVDRIVTTFAEGEFTQAIISERSVVVLHAPDIAVGLHSYFYRTLFRLPMPAGWHVLSWEPYHHRFQRLDDHTLIMELEGGEIQAPHLKVNDVISLSDMHVTVLGVNPLGPTKVAFRFNRPLDDPLLYFMIWENGRLRHTKIPPLGHALI